MATNMFVAKFGRVEMIAKAVANMNPKKVAKMIAQAIQQVAQNDGHKQKKLNGGQLYPATISAIVTQHNILTICGQNKIGPKNQMSIPSSMWATISASISATLPATLLATISATILATSLAALSEVQNGDLQKALRTHMFQQKFYETI